MSSSGLASVKTAAVSGLRSSDKSNDVEPEDDELFETTPTDRSDGCQALLGGGGGVIN